MKLCRGLILLCAVVLALPVAAYAQEAVVSGTVTDSTGGVLPGVTIRALHEATGNVFEGVTDERGVYRLAVRIGVHRLTAELPSFTGITRTVELLVGQTVVINLQMSPTGVAETVIVTGEAPLIETTTSSLSGNIDSRQMSELPVQGRGWMTLTLLAPGNRTTAISENPVQDRGDVREFQLNVDGQQVTQELGIGGQPRYSRDSIAEFQFISNRFDATQGRSMGVQVNVVTKSGTNRVSGGGGAYFRDDSFNAADPVLNRVLPYSNQQASTYLGGPIRRDRLHLFGNYEYEREPATYVWQRAWPSFNITREHNATKKMGGLRLDYQLSPQTRLMAKVHMAVEEVPLVTGSLANHPASANRQDRKNEEALVQFTQVLSNRALNEIRVGYSSWQVAQTNLTNWSRHWQAPNGVTGGHPRIRFRGFSILGNSNAPRLRNQGVYSLRDDFTFSYTAAGRHDLKLGGEWLYRGEASRNRFLSGGLIDARGGPVPANIEALFPDPFNVDTWNLAALSPLTRTYEVGVGNFSQPVDQNKLAAWAQDDWHVSNRLTLNLGLRYDLTTNAYSNEVGIPPWLEAGRPDDTNNVQPRLGFAYTLDDRTVLRGGAGLYFGDVLVVDSFWTLVSANIQQVRVNNDGRPDFAVNPFNGPLPTVEQALQGYCHVRNVPGCFFRNLSEIGPPREYSDFSYSWQNSIGIARQVDNDMAIEIDYVSNRNRDEKIIQENINLTFDPATGVNYPFSDRSRRPQPDWGTVSTIPHTGRSNYHGLQTAFTKRLSNRFVKAVCNPW
jgi:hypothetical protein